MGVSPNNIHIVIVLLKQKKKKEFELILKICKGEVFIPVNCFLVPLGQITIGICDNICRRTLKNPQQWRSVRVRACVCACVHACGVVWCAVPAQLIPIVC